VRDETFIGVVACGSVAISAIVAFYLAFMSGGALRLRRPYSITSGRGCRSELSAPTSGSRWTAERNVRALITFVGFLIHLFAVGYMHGEEGFYRFFAVSQPVHVSMLTLVLGDNFV
jgi:NADH-quinone oxidoreductase subunit L